MRSLALTILFAILFFAGTASAGETAGLCKTTGQIAQRWAVITYTLHDENRESAEMAALMDEADNVAAACPHSADALLWSASAKFSYASYVRGLKGFELVKEARDLLEKALAIDPKNSVAMADLGFLYYQVPGFPIGFGSDKKARELLEKSLAIAPDDIDTNFFYGEFLANKGEYGKAKAVLDHALKLTLPPGREISHEGRRKDVEALLAEIAQKNDRRS